MHFFPINPTPKCFDIMLPAGKVLWGAWQVGSWQGSYARLTGGTAAYMYSTVAIVPAAAAQLDDVPAFGWRWRLSSTDNWMSCIIQGITCECTKRWHYRAALERLTAANSNNRKAVSRKAIIICTRFRCNHLGLF